MDTVQKTEKTINNSVDVHYRNPEQDIAKGIAMIFVIICHCMPQMEIVDHINRSLFGYIMTFFFFVSGYYYKVGRGKSFWERIKKRAKRLLLPLLFYSLGVLVIIGAYSFISNGVSGLIDTLKAYIGMWITDPIASWLNLPTIGTFVGTQRAFEPYWFLIHMFSASIIYNIVVEYAFKSTRRFISVNVLLVTITTVLYALNIVLPWGFHNAFAIASIMLLGTFFGQHDLLSINSHKSSKTYVLNALVCLAFVFVLGWIFPRAGHISGSGQMTKILGPIEVPYTVLFSMVCSFFFVAFGRLFLKIPFVNKFFIWFGKNSLTILLTHLIFVFIAKLIVGADMNTTLGFVDYFDWRNMIAVLLTIVLVSGFLLLQGLILKKRKINN